MVSLDAKLSAAVGGPTAKALATHLGLHTVGDLLRHYPRRYVERGALTPFLDLVEGEHATVVAEVVSTSKRLVRTNLWKTDVVIRDAERAQHRGARNIAEVRQAGKPPKPAVQPCPPQHRALQRHHHEQFGHVERTHRGHRLKA